MLAGPDVNTSVLSPFYVLSLSSLTQFYSFKYFLFLLITHKIFISLIFPLTFKGKIKDIYAYMQSNIFFYKISSWIFNKQLKPNTLLYSTIF